MSAVLLFPLVAVPSANATADVQGKAGFAVTTTAQSVAARSDRRPVAGGVYDRKVGKTFISWAGQYEDSYVQSYDHRESTWSSPNRIADGASDAHNYPTMVQARDGHLLIFRGMHNVELRMSRSPRPHSADGVWEETLISKNAATYPMPFVTRDGTIYVFYRETTRDLDGTTPTDTRPMLYVVSKDNGRTWKTSTELTGDRFAIGSTSRADNMNEIYIGQLRQEDNGRVRIVYTLAGGGPEGNKHDRYHRNIYYTWFDPQNRHFYSASGKDLGTQIDDADQEKHLKVAETPLTLPNNVKSPDYIQQVGTTLGRPFLLWFMGDEAGGPLRNYLSTWNGRGWETKEVARGLRTREVEPVDLLTWRVYATEDGKPNVNTYLVRLGRFWSPETVIPTAKPVQRVEVVENFRDPARAIFSGASSDRDVAVADGDIYVAGFSRR
ncbi:BNR-4 repeat-containing protein [Lentzea sp. HUAS12]|uniref:BNR-4 repeat-containing protein n=1 Tax=Lentzea sp. HUAS12 TaxID=2951806 RepID=UPI00209E9B92|nr:BNR-4 repeat-containing protein [Lentzea sp. HUAS12]USX49877.1 BNR repeat-containing protein [Lentzea sp. HUAS12]